MVIIQNSGGVVNGSVDFSGVKAGGVSFYNSGSNANSGRWTASRASVFSAGNDTVTLDGLGTNTLTGGGSIDFGAGADHFVINADFIIGADPTALNPSGDTGTIAFGAGEDVLDVSGRLVTWRATVVAFGP